MANVEACTEMKHYISVLINEVRNTELLYSNYGYIFKDNRKRKTISLLWKAYRFYQKNI